MRRVRISHWKLHGMLYAKLFGSDGRLIRDLGLVSDRVITDDFAEYYVDCLQGLETGIADFKYHDSGIGLTDELPADDTLEIPTGVARAVGSQIEGANAKTYRTVGLITYDGAYDISEWGLFRASSGGIMMDRAVITPIPVTNGLGIRFIYDHSAISGG